MATKEYIVSPEGTIVSMALATPATNKYKNDRKEYYCRLMFDGNTEEGAKFKQQIQAINAKLVVTNSDTLDIPKGCYTVKAWTGGEYQPKVVDYTNEELEVVPHFTKGSTGKAIMTVSGFAGEQGGTLNLYEVALGDLELAESNFTSNGVSQALADKLKQINKG